MTGPDPRCGERGREGVCRPRSPRFHPKGNQSALPQLHCASRENTAQLRPPSTPVAYPALGPRDPQRVPVPPPRARAWSAIGASRPRCPPPSPPSLSRWRRSQRRLPRRLEPEQEAEAAAAARGGGVPSDWDGRPGRAGVPRRAERRWGWAKRVPSAAAFSPSCPATAEWTPHRSPSSTRFSSGSQRWGECGGGGADSGGMWSCHCPERWQRGLGSGAGWARRCGVDGRDLRSGAPRSLAVLRCLGRLRAARWCWEQLPRRCVGSWGSPLFSFGIFYSGLAWGACWGVGAGAVRGEVLELGFWQARYVRRRWPHGIPPAPRFKQAAAGAWRAPRGPVFLAGVCLAYLGQREPAQGPSWPVWGFSPVPFFWRGGWVGEVINNSWSPPFPLKFTAF